MTYWLGLVLFLQFGKQSKMVKERQFNHGNYVKLFHMNGGKKKGLLFAENDCVQITMWVF